MNFKPLNSLSSRNTGSSFWKTHSPEWKALEKSDASTNDAEQFAKVTLISFGGCNSHLLEKGMHSSLEWRWWCACSLLLQPFNFLSLLLFNCHFFSPTLKVSTLRMMVFLKNQQYFEIELSRSIELLIQKPGEKQAISPVAISFCSFYFRVPSFWRRNLTVFRGRMGTF